ncbi:Trp biosynthesis-associated membrane protein [Cellulomonas composti]|uniref:Trp biosynthesis protein n=1 Tax=Cellulomonas composti TaxID=266130 RepID=A0A511J644_9CELL|nr:Trp biosynthesis-associated membrane protein [Cellulomonas composti]GEL93461.1 hypothetical protein CCO02nite_01190 [Cellulomonas composti]
MTVPSGPSGPQPGERGSDEGAGPAPAPERRSRSGRGRAALAVLLLAGLSALVGVPTWLTAHGTSALAGDVTVRVPGSHAAPAIVGAAFVLAAAAAALALVGRIGRWVVAVVVVGAGVLVVAGAVGVLADPGGAAAGAVADATGVAHVVGDVEVSVWPWVAAVLGLVTVVCGGWLVRASRAWAGSGRHDVDAGGAGGTADAAHASAPVDDERAAWDALSRGDDPS